MKSLKPKTVYQFMYACLCKAGRTPVFFYSLITLAILLPLLSPGYILTLDMVFGPHISLAPVNDPHFIWLGILHVLNLLIPAALLQKFILIGIFLVAGLGMHSLARLLFSRHAKGYDLQWVCYFAGFLYVFNPFVYTRLMAGHYTLLIGYALLPYLLGTALRFYQQPSLRSSAQPLCLFIAISTVSLHAAGMAAVLLIFITGLQLWRHRHERYWQSLLRPMLLGFLCVLLINGSWLLPLIAGKGNLASTLESFTSADQRAFDTVSGEFGILPNILALQGFWGDKGNLYILPSDLLTWWLLPVVLLWGCIVIGGIWSYKHERRLGLLFGLLGVTGIVLAAGTSSLFAPIDKFLFEHIPLFSGYREPQKFVMLLVLAYAYYGSAGILQVRKLFITSQLRTPISIVVFLIPLGIAPLLVWGGAGQLKSKDYPKSWYRVNSQLKNDIQYSGKTLFLPWHLYMPFSFSSGVIASPGSTFFEVPVITSHDPELDGARGYAGDQDVKAANALLRSAALDEQLAQKLTKLGIRRIILAREFDYKEYNYLQRKSGIQKYISTDSIEVYRVIEKPEQ